MSDATQKQAAPIKTEERPTYELVIEDISARDAMGRKTYGTSLQPSNGRDSLTDAYQEALDLVLYLKNADLLASIQAEELTRLRARLLELLPPTIIVRPVEGDPGYEDVNPEYRDIRLAMGLNPWEVA